MCLLASIALLGQTGCSSSGGYAPTTSSQSSSSRSPYHGAKSAKWAPSIYRVKKGDTLYSIAWQFGRDFKTLARNNGIRRPYTIYVGQKIKLKSASKVAIKAAAKSTSRQRRSAASSRPKVALEKPVKLRKKSIKTISKPIKWRWPSQGRVIASFKRGDPRRKGLDIAGKRGQAILAAANGEIVYSGSGLLGLGMLIIVKHDESYLSAYGHNKKLLVKEGKRVRAGQKIAEMGKTGTDRVKLHFEIRYKGRPVDPKRFLPKHRSR